MVRALFMGQTGIDKKRHIETLREYAASKGKSIDGLYNVGDIMYEESRKAGKSITEGKILDLPLTELAVLRRSAFNKIQQETSQQDSATVVVGSHAVFRWNNQLFRAFELSDFESFRPDPIVTLVDDVDAVKLNLDGLRGAGRLPADTTYGMKDLLVWREEEILASEILASFLGVPHYVLGVSLEPEVTDYPLEIAHSLMFELWKKRSYVSFPISDAQAKPEIWDKVQDFRRRVRNRLCCFDPMMIDEKRLYGVLRQFRQENPTSSHLLCDVRGEQAQFSVQEIEGIIPDIDGQIVSRDYKLIDQSEMIVAYIPLDTDGSPLIAGGVQSELEYASASTKEVLVVWEASKDPTPFIHQRADKIFSSVAELERHLEKQFQQTGQLEFPL